MSERLKAIVRLTEARITPRTSGILHSGRQLRFTRSFFWNDAFQSVFEREIVPYFRAVQSTKAPHVIVDAGAATGLFAVAACVSFPDAQVHAFEPSARQRVLLHRNARRNGVSRRVTVNAVGLWDHEGHLAFRTHGAISAFQLAGALPDHVRYTEIVPVTTLDAWSRRAGIERLDLVKMDIEGSEIEALLGARDVLRQFLPTLLVQAYHVRSGARTFERCATMLHSLGYRCRELEPSSGMLHAVPGRRSETRSDSKR